MSRRLRYQVAVSLDGFIARPNGEYDWIVMDPSIDFGALFKEFDTAVMGRKTYEPGLFIEGKKDPTVSPPSARLFSRLSRESNKGGQILWVNDSLLPLRWISTGRFMWSRGQIA
jgi:dihydrofolate reductase